MFGHDAVRRHWGGKGFNRARRVSQARSRLSSIPTGCCLLLSVTKMPASDTVLQELKHQVLLFPLPSVLGTRLYRALE